jgi:hypothetical protein
VSWPPYGEVVDCPAGLVTSALIGPRMCSVARCTGECSIPAPGGLVLVRARGGALGAARGSSEHDEPLDPVSRVRDGHSRVRGTARLPAWPGRWGRVDFRVMSVCAAPSGACVLPRREHGPEAERPVHLLGGLPRECPGEHRGRRHGRARQRRSGAAAPSRSRGVLSCPTPRLGRVRREEKWWPTPESNWRHLHFVSPSARLRRDSAPGFRASAAAPRRRLRRCSRSCRARRSRARRRPSRAGAGRAA